jgi:hypothetical protein
MQPENIPNCGKPRRGLPTPSPQVATLQLMTVLTVRLEAQPEVYQLLDILPKFGCSTVT